MSKLYIVGTSIGNIEDISIRAIKAAFEAKLVLAEDTRIFKKMKMILQERYADLLTSINLSNQFDQKILSYRDQNHERIVAQLSSYLRDGEDLYLFSDSGMPGISDPGWKLIDEVIRTGFEVEVIPGPTAIINALILSGFPTDRFTFLGFLSRQEGKAKKLIEKYLNSENTVIVYESPFRVVKTLKAIEKHFPGINAAACGEMTKKHERVERGEVSDLIKRFELQKPQGEWVLCFRKD